MPDVTTGSPFPPTLFNVFNNTGDNLVVLDPDNKEFIQATFNGDSLDDPTGPPASRYEDFPSDAVRIGTGENFGNDQDGFSIQRTDTGFANDGIPTPGTTNVCFATGTHIATPRGFVPIESLRSGDLVHTQRSGPQPIRWIYAKRFDHQTLLANPNLCPLVHTSGRGLAVSRHHRILVTGKVAMRMFGEDELLVPAKDLIGLGGFDCTTPRSGLTYYHILLEEHRVRNLARRMGKNGHDVLTPF